MIGRSCRVHTHFIIGLILMQMYAGRRSQKLITCTEALQALFSLPEETYIRLHSEKNGFENSPNGPKVSDDSLETSAADSKYYNVCTLPRSKFI